MNSKYTVALMRNRFCAIFSDGLPTQDTMRPSTPPPSKDLALKAAMRASTQTNSEFAPLRTRLGAAYTSSPARYPLTDLPMSRTTPLTSKPRMIGNWRPLAKAPRRTLKSIGFRPQAWTSIKRSCSPGAGMGISLRWSTSGPPNSVTTMARMLQQPMLAGSFEFTIYDLRIVGVFMAFGCSIRHGTALGRYKLYA